VKYSREDGNIKIIICIAVVIIAIIIGVLIARSNSDKVVETVKQDPYEYFALVTAEEKINVVNKEGNKLLKDDYYQVYIPNQSKDVFFCFIDDENYKIVNKNEEELFANYTNVYPIVISSDTMDMEKQVLSYERDGKYGLIDYDGKEVAPAIYEEVSSLPNKPGCILVKKDGLCGVIESSTGKNIIEPKYNSIVGDEYSSEKTGYQRTGYIVSEKTNSGIIYGYIDYTGKMLIEPRYESIKRYPDNDNGDNIYLVFRENGKKGVFKNKKNIINAKYQTINFYNIPDIFVVNRNGKYGFINSDGDEILPTDYTSYNIAGNYISVKKDDAMMLYDVHGNLVNTNTYKNIIETDNPTFFIAVNDLGLYSIISKDFTIEDNYTNITYAFDNFFVFTNQDGKTGVLDVYSGVEIEPTYDVIIVLENAHALEARVGNQVDIYSNIIEKTLTMENGIVQQVKEGYYSVYNLSDLNYVDSNGHIVSNKDIFGENKLYSLKGIDGKWGFSDKDGNVKTECIYDIVTEPNEYGFASIYKDGKWGVINENGEVIVEPSYEIESYYFPSFVGKYLIDANETVSLREIK